MAELLTKDTKQALLSDRVLCPWLPGIFFGWNNFIHTQKKLNKKVQRKQNKTNFTSKIVWRSTIDNIIHLCTLSVEARSDIYILFKVVY